MGKITLSLRKDVEEDLRKYVAEKYPLDLYGKLSEISSDAIRYYLDHIGKTIFPGDEE